MVSQLIDLMYPSSSEEEGSIAVDSESEASIDYNDFDATSDDSDYEDSGSDSGSGSESLGDGMSDGSMSESSDNDSDATSSEEEVYFPAVVAPAGAAPAVVAPAAEVVVAVAAPAAPDVPVVFVNAGVAFVAVPIVGGPIRHIAADESDIAAQGIGMYWARDGFASMNLHAEGFAESLIQCAIEWFDQHPFCTQKAFKE